MLPPIQVIRLEHCETLKGPWSIPGLDCNVPHHWRGAWAGNLPTPDIEGLLYHKDWQHAAPDWRRFVRWFPRKVRESAAANGLVIRIFETTDYEVGHWQVVFDRATAKSISEYPPVRTRARENQHKVKS